MKVRLVKTVCAAVCLLVGLLVAPAIPTRAADAGMLLDRLTAVAGAPSRAALDAALTAYQHAAQAGSVARTGLLTVIDYTRPSTEPRLWVIDLSLGRILYRELVAHGRESGENTTRAFSNQPGSLMSSMGLFVTDASYVGRNGYSLRLRGLEPGVNDRAFDRAIVVHGADYVSQALAARLGRIGRSFGCPAVRSAVARSLIDTIKNGTVLYAYGGVVTDAAAHLTAP